MAQVYLNGGFIPESEASVSVHDRGFIFGDGVYEVIPAYGGKIFRFDEHMARLEQSLSAIQIVNPHSREQWKSLLLQLITLNQGEDQSIYLHVTRGVAKREHSFQQGMQPTVLIMSSPLLPLDPASLSSGIKAVTLEDIRWQQCHIKAISLLPNILLRQQAVDAGAEEAILIRNGYATEGAASNLFIVKGGVIFTFPSGPYLLPGITRDLLIQLARENGFVVEEREITRDELQAADEVWLSSSTKEVVPVTELDGELVGDGRPGRVWKQLYQFYQMYKEQLRSGAVT